MTVSPEDLAAAGRLLLGEAWKRPMARLLGQHHPDGPRESIDPRAPFRWAHGPDPDNNKGRPVPPWVGPVLAQLLAERAKDALELAARLKGEQS